MQKMKKKEFELSNAKDKYVYIHVVHTNCVESFTDSFRVAQAFYNEGAFITDKPNDANIIVVSTCGYMNCQRNLSEETINEFVKEYGSSKEIIVCGCFFEFSSSPLLDEITIVQKLTTEEFIENNIFVDIDSVASPEPYIANNFLKSLSGTNPGVDEKVFNMELSSGHTVESAKLKRDSPWFSEDLKNNVQFIRICQGCFGNCTYCAVSSIKGKPFSTPKELIKDVVRKSLKNGVSTFCLAADDAAAYGCEDYRSYTDGLVKLLRELCQISQKINIYINYLEPNSLYFDKLVSVLMEYPQISRVCIPIQSGSFNILQKMNRRYDSREILEIIKRIKNRRSKDLFISTHLIIGYPGETERDFEDTLDAIESNIFDEIICTDFCPTTGTIAADLPQLSQNIILERLKRARELAEQIKSLL